MQRLASRWVRPHETEDVAAEVIYKAAEDLKEQYITGKLNLAPGTQFATWFRSFCGRPFSKRRSGAITNVIRKIWQTCRHASYDPDQESGNVDENMLDPQQELINAEDAETEQFHLQCLQIEMSKMDRDDPRASFMLRLSSGVHDFPQLDADALVLFAKELRLPRVQVALVKEAAQVFVFEPGQKSLSNAQIGSLAGVGESGVRYQLSKAKMGLLKALNRR